MKVGWVYQIKHTKTILNRMLQCMQNLTLTIKETKSSESPAFTLVTISSEHTALTKIQMHIAARVPDTPVCHAAAAWSLF